MVRITKLYVIGLVLVLSAIAAPQALAHKFNSDNYPQTLTESKIGTDIMTFNAGTASCSEVTYSGSLAGASEAPEVTPKYSGCTMFGFISASIDVNGCKYRYHVTTTSVSDLFEGSMDIVCSGTSTIVLTAPGCTVTIGSQNGLSRVVYENTTFVPRDVDVSWNISKGVVYTVDPGCATTKPGTFSNGSWSGESTVRGESGEVWID